MAFEGIDRVPLRTFQNFTGNFFIFQTTVLHKYEYVKMPFRRLVEKNKFLAESAVIEIV